MRSASKGSRLLFYCVCFSTKALVGAGGGIPCSGPLALPAVQDRVPVSDCRANPACLPHAHIWGCHTQVPLKTKLRKPAHHTALAPPPAPQPPPLKRDGEVGGGGRRQRHAVHLGLHSSAWGRHRDKGGRGPGCQKNINDTHFLPEVSQSGAWRRGLGGMTQTEAVVG